MNEDEFQVLNKRNRRTGNSVICACLGVGLAITYVLRYKEECEPRLDEWLDRMRMILFGIFIAGVCSWVDLGAAVLNAAKIIKFLGVVWAAWHGFVGIYLVLYDETCLGKWPLGFYAVMAIGSIPIFWTIVCCAMLGCLLGQAYMIKEKDS